MREIIFRGKHVDHGEWVYGDLIHSFEYVHVGKENKFLKECRVDPNTVGQFTGMHDKNGKEIYEGDIVKGYFNTDKVEDYLWLALSEMEKETGTKVFIVSDIHFGCNEPVPEELEVIGNVHDHPHFLTDGRTEA